MGDFCVSGGGVVRKSVFNHTPMAINRDSPMIKHGELMVSRHKISVGEGGKESCGFIGG